MSPRFLYMVSMMLLKSISLRLTSFRLNLNLCRRLLFTYFSIYLLKSNMMSPNSGFSSISFILVVSDVFMIPIQISKLIIFLSTKISIISYILYCLELICSLRLAAIIISLSTNSLNKYLSLNSYYCVKSLDINLLIGEPLGNDSSNDYIL